MHDEHATTAAEAVNQEAPAATAENIAPAETGTKQPEAVAGDEEGEDEDGLDDEE